MNINPIFSNSYNKGAGMRDIFHKANQILAGRGKKIVIREKSEDAQCITDVRKSFVFLAQPVLNTGDPTAPQVSIKKSFDSVTRSEHFNFRVKGYFFVNHNRQAVRMDYCHSLKVSLRWKSKTTSPKKSVTLA